MNRFVALLHTPTLNHINGRHELTARFVASRRDSSDLFQIINVRYPYATRLNGPDDDSTLVAAWRVSIDGQWHYISIVDTYTLHATTLPALTPWESGFARRPGVAQRRDDLESLMSMDDNELRDAANVAHAGPLDATQRGEAPRDAGPDDDDFHARNASR